MSRLYKKIIGSPQGTTGDIVFRIRRGVTYMCARPAPFTAGTTPADIARRKKFGMACSLSARVNQIPKLKELWERFEGDLSSANLITRANYTHVTGETINAGADITPRIGSLTLPIITAVLTATDISVEFDAMPDTNTPAETRIRLIGLIHLSQPVDPADLASDFIEVISPAQALDFAVPTIFAHTLNSQDSLRYALYTGHKLFWAIVTEDADGKLYQYSKTASV